MTPRMNADHVIDQFALIGHALWQTQAVEHTLHTYIALKDSVGDRKSVTAEELEAIIAAIARNTLGKALRISEAAEVLPDVLQRRAVDFNTKRNWLVHRAAAERNFSVAVDSTYWQLIAQLEAYVEEARALNHAIADALDDFVVSKGVSRRWLAHETQKQWRSIGG